MADHSAQDKTEAPTAKRREEAVEKGNVAKSMELNSVMVMFAGIISMQFIGGELFDRLSGFTINTYLNAHSIQFTTESFSSQFRAMLVYFGVVLAPFFILLLIAGVSSNVMQTGFIFAKKAITPKFEKISPMKGLKRMFSMRSLVETLKGIIKITLVSSMAYWVLSKHIAEYWVMYDATATQVMILIGAVLLELALKVGGVLLVMALADYAYQKYEHTKNLKMTKQEVRDETKQYEGNQEVKGRMKSVARQLARSRMMAAVPDATVVVTNPTYIAIAIKYDPKNKSDAPTVVAKGKRKMAERIKQLAAENDVPIIENKPLARSLFDVIEPGMQIPFLFYQAVAEILAQVYKMNMGKRPAIPEGANA